MTHSEPSRPWQDAQHQRILRGDPTAFAQLAELALPHLITFLQRQFVQIDSHLQETAVIDSLLSYQSHPERYDPQQLPLFAYLRMAARHDLLNALDSKNRERQRLLDIDEPAVQTQLPVESLSVTAEFELDEWLEQYTDHSRHDLLDTFMAEELEEAADRDLFLLMLNGVRETEPYAEIMGVTHLPVSEQRPEVKRAKDRLKKRFGRFVERLKK
jgi:DNA-directed RNA polymerase specialized sigma24 family protein